MKMVKGALRDEIDAGAPSAGFVILAEVLDHEEDVRVLTCWWSMIRTAHALK